MAGGAINGSLDRVRPIASAVDDIDAGWDEMPESTSVPLRHPVSVIVLPRSVTVSALDDVDEPTLEIGETFADDVDLEDA